MIIERKEISIEDRAGFVKKWLDEPHHRLGLITSLDGAQLITLLLNTENPSLQCLETPLKTSYYPSLTPKLPLCHWQERICWDMFGLIPEGHPRLKPVLQVPFENPEFFPLRNCAIPYDPHQHPHLQKYLEVKGDGVYEIPVGPIHAGVIEPGHFRFSCLGEIIFNLEIHLGYVHRGSEKRLTEVPWHKARFVAEAAATDSVGAYALAHAIAMETLCDISPTLKGLRLRRMALEIERVAIHIGDLIGFAADIGYLGVAASFSRLRGAALRLCDLISGNRFLRGFIRPGGVAREVPTKSIALINELALKLENDIKPVVHFLLDNQTALERMSNIGKVKPSIAKTFGLVGVAARAAGIEYDARLWSDPIPGLKIAVEKNGDVLSRCKVRVAEINYSLAAIRTLCSEALEDDPPFAPMPESLPKNAIGCGIVEGHRGELIHLVFTDGEGKISRYAIKDPSVNNWTALAIAVRYNLLADFPLCNKSFSLAYAGHDL